MKGDIFGNMDNGHPQTSRGGGVVGCFDEVVTSDDSMHPGLTDSRLSASYQTYIAGSFSVVHDYGARASFASHDNVPFHTSLTAKSCYELMLHSRDSGKSGNGYSGDMVGKRGGGPMWPDTSPSSGIRQMSSYRGSTIGTFGDGGGDDVRIRREAALEGQQRTTMRYGEEEDSFCRSRGGGGGDKRRRKNPRMAPPPPRSISSSVKRRSDGHLFEDEGREEEHDGEISRRSTTAGNVWNKRANGGNFRKNNPYYEEEDSHHVGAEEEGPTAVLVGGGEAEEDGGASSSNNPGPEARSKSSYLQYLGLRSSSNSNNNNCGGTAAGRGGGREEAWSSSAGHDQQQHGDDDDDDEDSSVLLFKDIVGNGEAIQALYESTILPHHLPASVFVGIRRLVPTVLLYGPPGTGKTSLAKAAAGELGGNFFELSPSSCLSKFQGESEKHLKRLFSAAKENAPSIIFIDELDSIACRRSSSSSSSDDPVSRRLLAEFLIQMSQLKSKSQVTVIGATNRVEDIDPAVVRRFSRRILVDYPTRTERAELIRSFLAGVPTSLEDDDIESIAEKTGCLWSGADLELLCREAAMVAVREAVIHQQQQQQTSASGDDDDEFMPPPLLPRSSSPSAILSPSSSSSSSGVRQDQEELLLLQHHQEQRQEQEQHPDDPHQSKKVNFAATSNNDSRSRDVNINDDYDSKIGAAGAAKSSGGGIREVNTNDFEHALRVISPAAVLSAGGATTTSSTEQCHLVDSSSNNPPPQPLPSSAVVSEEERKGDECGGDNSGGAPPAVVEVVKAC